MPSVFFQRPMAYKIGMIMIILAAIMALYGVVAPGWIKYDVNTRSGTGSSLVGLWFTCTSGFSVCVSLDWDLSAEDGEVIAVKVLSISGLISLSIACLNAVILNCSATAATTRRSMEVLGMLGGIQLFVACMIFVGNVENFIYISFNWSFGPSFGMTLTAAILAIIGSAVVARVNQPVNTNAHFGSAQGVVVQNTQSQNQSVYPGAVQQPAPVYNTPAAQSAGYGYAPGSGYGYAAPAYNNPAAESMPRPGGRVV